MIEKNNTTLEERDQMTQTKVSEFYSKTLNKALQRLAVPIDALKGYPEKAEEMIDLRFILQNKSVLDDFWQKKRSWFFSCIEEFELDKVADFIMKLNGEEGETGIMALLDYKVGDTAMVKLFLRAKPLNDLVRAVVLTERYEDFFAKLKDFAEKNKFYFWYENDQEVPSKFWRTVKIFLYKKGKTYYGRVVPVEIQVTTTSVWNYSKAANDHDRYEQVRLGQFEKCKQVYQSHNIQDGDLVMLMEALDLKGTLQVLLYSCYFSSVRWYDKRRCFGFKEYTKYDRHVEEKAKSREYTNQTAHHRLDHREQHKNSSY
jgi:hypothetical protein